MPVYSKLTLLLSDSYKGREFISIVGCDTRKRDKNYSLMQQLLDDSKFFDSILDPTNVIRIRCEKLM